MIKNSLRSCWIVTDGTTGTVTQAMGLAESVGFKTIITKIFKSKFSIPFFPSLMHLWAKPLMTKESDVLCEPWPQCVIGCGRRIIPFMMHIKKARPKTFCIYIMDPQISSKYFDLVIKMPHDSIKGENVITSSFSINRIQASKLKTEAKKFKATFNKYSAPYYTILIGGNTKNYKMDKAAIQNLLTKIDNIYKKCKGSVLITPSRRTPQEIIEALNTRQNSKLYVADLNKSNPYFAMLALANKIFVTNDSVNMISEAYACQKEVQIIPLLGLRKAKSLRLLKALKNLPDYKQSNNNKKIAQIVRERFLKAKPEIK